ncbi:zinc finger protein 154-like [Elgaria multicarinata webbii]|uniref:zinc finger protein 154-like n=1 Tax=Elgaria multicarinata webbii TaxID=159646 RepID=UPI002FCD49C9
MAAVEGDAPGLAFPFEAMLNQGLKTEEPEPTGPELRNSTGNRLCSIRVESFRDCEERTPSEEVKQEPHKRLQECWEAQLQAFLKRVDFPQSEWRNPQLPGTVPVQTMAFLPPCEGVADSREQPGARELAQFLPGMCLEAQQTGGQLSGNAEADCRQVKEDLDADATILDTDAGRQRFRQFRYLEADGPQEVWRQLWRLCHQWLKPERRTKEQILELVVLEQFLTILPQEVQKWVRDGGPQTSSWAVTLAEDFLLRHPEVQVPELIKVVAVHCPEGERASSDTRQGLLFREIKQEVDCDASPPGGDGEPQEEKQNQAEHSREAEPCWMLPGRGQQDVSHRLDQGEVSECRQENCPLAKARGEHLLGDRTALERVQAGGKRHICSVCEKSFSQRSSLTVHKRTHTGERPYECPDCGKRFSHCSNLIAHKIVHTGDRPYPCADCGDRFRHRSHLIAHRRVHTGERPHKCTSCGKSFNQRSALTVHERTHTGERPYKCSDCGKGFNQRSILLAHERTHTGERPFKCSDCGKSFKQLSALNAHARSHTGERPYSCSDCGKSFTRSSLLAKHKRTHTGEKPYGCADCGKHFSQRSQLVNHKRTHTGGET